MKTWHLISLTIALVAVGTCGWWLSSSSEGKKIDDEPKVIRVRKSVSVAKKKAEKSAMRISESTNRRKASKEDEIAKKWDPFRDDKIGFDMDVDFCLDEGVVVEMSRAVRDVLTRMSRAQAKFDKKGVQAAVRRLLAMIAKGESVSAQAKIQAINALRFVGGGISENLPEVVQLAADENPEVAQVSLSALQEMLWDFETTSQQISDAIVQLVGLTTDAEVLTPFIFEMSDMPAQLKVSTSLAILDSQNVAAIAVLDDNKSFVFDDFDGKVQTREDIVQYGKDHAE